MIKLKKYFGILFIIGVMLVVFISDAFSPGPNEPELLVKAEGILEEEVIPVAEPELDPIPNEVDPTPTNTISVKDYGAKGDGITDDSKAFQKAINESSSNGTILVIPESNTPYLILIPLELKSNTHISGYGASVFMPSHRQVQNILFSSSKEEISNVSIKGLSFLSENDQEGTGEYKDSLTSYIQGIYFFGINNLTISDVQMDSLFIGIKLDASKNGKKSENISIDNLEIYNSRTPLFITSTAHFKMTNSILDASGGATKFLHSAYIRGDTSDIEFEKVQFINSPGGGVHIYNSNKDMSPPENIRIVDSHIENTKVGVYIYSGAKDVYITNLIMINNELPFKINNATRINIEKVRISNNAEAIKAVGLFSMAKVSELKIVQVTLDGIGMTGYLFDIDSEITDLLISEMIVSQLNNVGLVYGSSESFQNLVIENSRFEWTSVKRPLIHFSSIGSYAVVRDNQFINNGKKMSRTVFNTSITNVIFEDNYYIGF